MKFVRVIHLCPAIAGVLSTSMFMLACNDDPGVETSASETSGDGDGDPGDGDGAPGDGDGDGGPGDGDGGPGDGDGDGAPGPGELVRFTLDANASGPAWVEIADFTGDGQLDVVVSHFGELGFSIPDGKVVLYTRTGNLNSWLPTTLLGDGDGVKFPNQTSAHDIDGDGDLDLIVPYGFLVCVAIPLGEPCGGLLWLEQTANGWTRHDVVDNGALFYHHGEFVDFDGDGVEDLVTVAEQGPAMLGGEGYAEAQWFGGTGSGFMPTVHMIGQGLGSKPSVRDIDGDGDLDVASAQYFDHSASFAWFERTADPDGNNPDGSFTHHVIDDQVGGSIQLSFIEDFIGDGQLMAVGSNHTNTMDDPNAPESAIYLYEIPGDPTQAWPRSKISTGIVSAPSPVFGPQGAPGIFGWGDVDGDDDIDLFVSGDGDKRVFWLEQAAPGAFTTRVVESPLGQAGGMKFADLDGDGSLEVVVTGYEQNVVYIYHWELL